jgi:hypothetical protein
MTEVGFKVEPNYHLLTAGVVANAIRLAAKCYGGFTGRDAGPIEASCTHLIVETLRIMPMFDPRTAEGD